MWLARMRVWPYGLPAAPPFTGSYFRPAQLTISQPITIGVTAGAAAVLGEAAPPVTVTATTGTGRWNDTLQKPMGRRWIINALGGVLITYIAVLTTGLIRLGFAGELLPLVVETTLYAGLCLIVLLETVTFHSRRREYRADRVAVAAVGTAGLIRWRSIAERD